MSFKLIKRPGFYSLIKRTPPLIVLFSFLLVIITLSGCTGDQRGNLEKNGDSLVIACTIPPQEEFIKAIGGDNVTVFVMVPPGASPHTYEPSPSQIKGLESADMYISLGSGLEFENRWLSRIQGMYPNLPIINSSKDIVFITGEEHTFTENGTAGDTNNTGNGKDPHVWVSLRNAATIVNTTYEALSRFRPAKKEMFDRNRDNYLANLSQLDREIEKELSTLSLRKIIVYHPSLGYFSRDYNLTQISVEVEGHEPAAKSLAALIDEAKSENITMVFAEPEESTRGAEKLSDEINGRMVIISTLSSDYIRNMQHIADKISGQ